LLAALLLLLLPGAATAQDPPADPPPSFCDGLVTGPGDPLLVDTSTGEDGECAIVTVEFQPAWRWLDASISVACAAPSGSGTSAEKDGWYLWGTTRDESGAIVSEGFVGTAWSGTGCNGSPRVYHGQLWLQGPHRSIALVVERRRWPFSGSKVVSGPMERGYEGSVWVH
jgi:hypothetical protein